MLWIESPDDRAFLRELSREIVATVAPAELADFDAQIACYFACPHPPTTQHRLTTTARGAAASRPLTPVVPAVLSAVLTLLVMEIQETAQVELTDVIKLGLKHLFRQHGFRPKALGRRLRLGKLELPAMTLVVYIYTQPVAIRIALSHLTDVAYETASIFRLDDARAEVLVSAIIARLCLDPGVA